jgi:hypothetical protein
VGRREKGERQVEDRRVRGRPEGGAEHVQDARRRQLPSFRAEQLRQVARRVLGGPGPRQGPRHGRVAERLHADRRNLARVHRRWTTSSSTAATTR